MQERVIIIGAGPTGLGAAWRLQQAGHQAWELWEADNGPGGLSRSYRDEAGFTWDLGGHVQFSHYASFDRAMTEALGSEGWLIHDRESWVRSCGTWVPYPYQYNLHRLPPAERLSCFQGLIEAARNGRHEFRNFGELIRGCFGQGLADLFMVPYNTKVWAYPPEELGTQWIGERVALPDLKKVAESLVLNEDSISWGPNNRFQFPKHGGTGAIWNALAARLPRPQVHYGRRLRSVDLDRRVALDEDGREAPFDALISTMPLDLLVAAAGLDSCAGQVGRLKYSSTHIIGVALHGAPGPDVAGKCWMYFPEANCPFYRVTVFSHYSPHNVPDIGKYWSLMAEVSESPAKPVVQANVIAETIQGMINTGLIESPEQVHHTWHRRIERSYPTPSLDRDAVLEAVLPALERHGVYSRGRFGGWRYEVGNQDHSFMQGVEAVNRILTREPELTLWFPNLVNAMHPVFGKDWR